MKAQEPINSIWESVDAQSPLFQALIELPSLNQRAINLRFWENCTIAEISGHLRLSWDQTDRLISDSLFQLRAQLEKAEAPLVLKLAS